MSWYVVCPDGYVRPENNGPHPGGSWPSEEVAGLAAGIRDREMPAANCCGLPGLHFVQQWIWIRLLPACSAEQKGE
jgi:hypothetical protein